MPRVRDSNGGVDVYLVPTSITRTTFFAVWVYAPPTTPLVCVCYRVCVCRPISYVIMHIQTMHSCDIRISLGSHECGESGRAIGRVQAFSFVTFKVQVYDFFLVGGGNQSSPLRRQIALSESLSPLAKSKIS